MRKSLGLSKGALFDVRPPDDGFEPIDMRLYLRVDGRALTERPDLFAGVIDSVPAANTLRAEFSPNGPPNIPEFGSVKTELPHWPEYCVIWKPSVPGGAGTAIVTVDATFGPDVVTMKFGGLLAASVPFV